MTSPDPSTPTVSVYFGAQRRTALKLGSIALVFLSLVTVPSCSGDRSETPRSDGSTTESPPHGGEADRSVGGRGYVGPVIRTASAAYLARTGDSIGRIHEARFVGTGRVVTLQRNSPFLALFAVTGDLLWAGAPSGLGAGQLVNPQALATRADEVMVFERDRVSRWYLDGDSLRFRSALKIPAYLTPLSATSGCGNEWLLYGQDDRDFAAPVTGGMPLPTVQYVHTVQVGPDSVIVHPLWGEERDLGAIPIQGGGSVSINRYGERIVLLHRSSPSRAGLIMELDCTGRVIRALSEASLLHGADSVPVLAPTTSDPRPWTSGIVALPDGLVMALHRFFPIREDERVSLQTNTEVFRYADGQYSGSVMVEGQWDVVDYRTGLGILMVTFSPYPHFVLMPEARLRP